MILSIRRTRVVALASVLGAAACSSTNGNSSTTNDGGSPSAATDDAGAETPPMEATKLEAWLAQRVYKSWHGETAVHEARSPSPHGFNRIYSNQVISAQATGTASWPVGAAAVKELYATATDTTPVGYAVYLKTQSDSAGGANWYWYERVPLSSSAPHDTAGVVANGLGSSGPAKTKCVGCHMASGSDMPHTPSPGGRDEVYTPVP